MKIFSLKSLFFTSFVIFISQLSLAQSNPGGEFKNPEENFKAVMKMIMESYIDKNISQEDLYRGATAGMLNSLNGKDQSWNKLITPREMQELQIELSGKVTGIGVSMKFDEHTGYATVLGIIPGSVAEKAGIRTDDQILSVDGKKFKGKEFPDMVSAVRGEAGQSVSLKVLREDQVLTFNLKRSVVPWISTELQMLPDHAALLVVGYFNEATPKMVEKAIGEINSKGVRKLIVDLRDNQGGAFNEAIKVAELFLPKDSLIVTTKDRSGKVESFKSTKGLLNPDMKLIVLTNKETSSGAELFAASLKENKGAKIIGEKTNGKWNAQRLEILSNKYAVKFTVKEFQSPKGNTYQSTGLKPDVEVVMIGTSSATNLRNERDINQRLAKDSQLKAAAEWTEVN